MFNWYKIAKMEKIASMSVMVSRYTRDDTCDNLLNMTARLTYLLFTKWMDKRDNAYFKEFFSIPSNEIIAPDGEGYDKPAGTINFYTEAIQKEKVKLFTDHIVSFLRGYGMQVNPPTSDMSRMYKSPVVRIPITENAKGLRVQQKLEDIPPEANLANGNAYFIFRDVLQIPDFEEGFVVKAQDLKTRIEYFENETKLQEGEYAGQNGVIMDMTAFSDPDILSGKKAMSTYDEQRVRERLMQIKQIADWAINHGYEELVIG